MATAGALMDRGGMPSNPETENLFELPCVGEDRLLERLRKIHHKPRADIAPELRPAAHLLAPKRASKTGKVREPLRGLLHHSAA